MRLTIANVLALLHDGRSYSFCEPDILLQFWEFILDVRDIGPGISKLWLEAVVLNPSPRSIPTDEHGKSEEVSNARLRVEE